MTKKADFNAEEWSTVVDAPLYAGMRVVTADRGGRLRESVALTRVYADARAHHGESELLDDVVKSPPSIDADRLAHEDIATLASEQLRAAIAILEAKATAEEVAAYKKFVMAVAQAAAAAHKEGGVLGVGGKPISEAEQQALDEIATALGTTTGGSQPA
jgi:hypothetical protein